MEPWQVVETDTELEIFADDTHAQRWTIGGVPSLVYAPTTEVVTAIWTLSGPALIRSMWTPHPGQANEPKASLCPTRGTCPARYEQMVKKNSCQPETSFVCRLERWATLRIVDGSVPRLRRVSAPRETVTELHERLLEQGHDALGRVFNHRALIVAAQPDDSLRLSISAHSYDRAWSAVDGQLQIAAKPDEVWLMWLADDGSITAEVRR